MFNYFPLQFFSYELSYQNTPSSSFRSDSTVEFDWPLKKAPHSWSNWITSLWLYFGPVCPLKKFFFLLTVCYSQRASGDCDPALKLPGLGLVRRPNLGISQWGDLSDVSQDSIGVISSWWTVAPCVVHFHFLVFFKCASSRFESS